MSPMKPNAVPFVMFTFVLGVLLTLQENHHRLNAAYWCLHMEADINDNSCMDLVGEYNPQAGDHASGR